MAKKIWNEIIDTIKEEWKFILFNILLLIVLNIPLNYYIVMGGGIDDVSSRVKVEDSNKGKGSLNISYVTQINANVLFYGLSYIIPTWERENANDYKYTENESLNDISFRGDLDLKTANGTATYWAYTLANKKVELSSARLYVIATYNDEFETTLKAKDEILSIDGNHYETVQEYADYIQTRDVGSTVTVKIIRNNKEQEVETNIYEAEERKIIGVSLQYVKEYTTDPPVDIQFQRQESGPSGGLITTLEIYNQLTEKDITKGYTIAGTGTIEEDGTIGQIGGIEHKILGAVTAKADIFLCPNGRNYKNAKKYVKEKKLKIKLIKVDSIEDAINKLEELK